MKEGERKEEGKSADPRDQQEKMPHRQEAWTPTPNRRGHAWASAARRGARVVRTAQWVSGSCICGGGVDRGLTMVWLGQRNVEGRVRVEESRMEMTIMSGRVETRFAPGTRPGSGIKSILELSFSTV